MKIAEIKFVPILLSVFFILLQYRLWFDSGGIQELFQLKKSVQVETDKNAALKVSNDQLLLQIQHLKTSPDAIESRARQELGMIKKDETFYQVLDDH